MPKKPRFLWKEKKNYTYQKIIKFLNQETYHTVWKTQFFYTYPKLINFSTKKGFNFSHQLEESNFLSIESISYTYQKKVFPAKKTFLTGWKTDFPFNKKNHIPKQNYSIFQTKKTAWKICLKNLIFHNKNQFPVLTPKNQFFEGRNFFTLACKNPFCSKRKRL